MTVASDRQIPKYEVLTQSLRARIASMAPHDALPTERDLQAEFGVSRATVRQAIRVLVGEGLVYNVQGSGTYVSNTDVVSKTLRLTGFSQDMRLRGMTPSSSVLGHETMPADPDVAHRLMIEPGTDVLHVRRLRLADDLPMALEGIYLVQSMLGAATIDLTRSLYDQLSDAGIAPARAAEVIDAMNLDAQQARLLDQAVGAAALRVRRVTFTHRGRPVEYAETVYRGDRYDFEIVIGTDQ